VAVVENTIRREILGLEKGKRIPKSVKVHQYFGISMDERGRARRIKDNMLRSTKWATPHFPLIEHFMTRPDCLNYLADKVPHQTPRSACVFCPFHSDAEWRRLKAEEPEEFERSVRFERRLHAAQSQQEVLKGVPYLHSSLQPLDTVDFAERPARQQLDLFGNECEGMCGV
jgi:hypothetical protein